jgi:hypothetical protein
MESTIINFGLESMNAVRGLHFGRHRVEFVLTTEQQVVKCIRVLHQINIAHARRGGPFPGIRLRTSTDRSWPGSARSVAGDRQRALPTLCRRTGLSAMGIWFIVRHHSCRTSVANTQPEKP